MTDYWINIKTYFKLIVTKSSIHRKFYHISTATICFPGKFLYYHSCHIYSGMTNLKPAKAANQWQSDLIDWLKHPALSTSSKCGKIIILKYRRQKKLLELGSKWKNAQILLVATKQSTQLSQLVNERKHKRKNKINVYIT